MIQGVDTVLAVGRYICLGVLPMLQDYFDEVCATVTVPTVLHLRMTRSLANVMDMAWMQIYPRLKGSEDHKKTAQELFDVSKELFEAPFPPEVLAASHSFAL